MAFWISVIPFEEPLQSVSWVFHVFHAIFSILPAHNSPPWPYLATSWRAFQFTDLWTPFPRNRWVCQTAQVLLLYKAAQRTLLCITVESPCSGSSSFCLGAWHMGQHLNCVLRWVWNECSWESNFHVKKFDVFYTTYMSIWKYREITIHTDAVRWL